MEEDKGRRSWREWGSFGRGTDAKQEPQNKCRKLRR